MYQIFPSYKKSKLRYIKKKSTSSVSKQKVALLPLLSQKFSLLNMLTLMLPLCCIKIKLISCLLLCPSVLYMTVYLRNENVIYPMSVFVSQTHIYAPYFKYLRLMYQYIHVKNMFLMFVCCVYVDPIIISQEICAKIAICVQRKNAAFPNKNVFYTPSFTRYSCSGKRKCE